MWFCKLPYPACNPHTLCCIVTLACLALQHFSTLSHKRNNFLKKVFNIKCVFWVSLQILSETFFILKRIRGGININAHRSLLKYLPFLSDFNEDWFFSTDFRKIFKYQVSWKLFLTDAQTNMTKLIVACSNYANAPKNCPPALMGLPTICPPRCDGIFQHVHKFTALLPFYWLPIAP
jgi:hypothetical protein